MSFGDRLKQAREKNKLSQQELADLLNITDGTISNYEKGVAFPRWDKIIRLCDILNVNPNYLFWDDLNDNMKSKIMEQMTFSDNSDIGTTLYKKLDETDKAFIRGEMTQMLRAEKYTDNSDKQVIDYARIAAKGRGTYEQPITEDQHKKALAAIHQIESENNNI